MRRERVASHTFNRKSAAVFQLCHGDLHKTNLLWQPTGTVTLLDFDLCGPGWRAYDLAVLFWSTRWLPQAKAVRVAYLEGYAQVRPLEIVELLALPYFVAIRDIFIMTTEVGHAQRGVVGARSVDDTLSTSHLHFLHAWMEAVAADTYLDP